MDYKSEMEDLEKLLSSTREELSRAQELNQNKEFTIHELQTGTYFILKI